MPSLVAWLKALISLHNLSSSHRIRASKNRYQAIRSGSLPLSSRYLICADPEFPSGLFCFHPSSTLRPICARSKCWAYPTVQLLFSSLARACMPGRRILVSPGVIVQLPEVILPSALALPRPSVSTRARNWENSLFLGVLGCTIKQLRPNFLHYTSFTAL